MSKILLIIFMLASTDALADINKWVDAQGQVHYSDQPPPPSVQPRTLRTDSADAAGSGIAETDTVAERTAKSKRAELEKQAAAKITEQKLASEKALKVNCENAQQNLRTLQSGVRMVEIGANGEQSYINDAQRQQRIAKAQQDISVNCK